VNLRSYTAVCNCNANSLKTDLNNLSSVIESVNNFGAAYLSNNQFEKSKTKISPNPFLNVFSIETEDVISKYTIFDSTGKQIESTSNKNELDNQVSKLQAGFYILNLAFENGKAYNYKLVKK
jgi:FAD synthase